MSVKEARSVWLAAGNEQEDGFGSNDEGEVECEGETKKINECMEEDKRDTKGMYFIT